MSRYRNGFHALRKNLAWRAALPLAIACGVGVPASATAQTRPSFPSSPVPFSSWATTAVPQYISMYEVMPTTPANPPPVLVAAHYCGGSASAMYNFTNMNFVEELANEYGVIMVFPQTQNNCGGPLYTGSNGQNGCSSACWDVGSTASLTNGGNGDTEAIAEMIEYEVKTNHANPNRVYVMGDSSGAMMVEALAAVYPNVFQAGAEYSGVPAGCWSDGYEVVNGVTTNNWGGTCANGQDTMTAAQWGALVDKMDPGYSGPRPRLQLYHGSMDTTINYTDQVEAVLEWTNVLLGLNPTPSSTSSPPTAASIDATSSEMTAAISGAIGGTSAEDIGFLEWDWKNSCDFAVLQAFTDVGGNHNTPIDAQRMWDFFGLTDPTGPDPEAAACGDGGTSSTSGSSSTAGSGGTGSSSGGSGASGSSGSPGSSSAGGNGSTSGGTGSTTGGNGSAGTGSTTGGGGNNSGGGGNDGTSGSGGSGGKSIAGGCAVTMQGPPGSAGAMFAAGLLGLALCGRRRRRD
jgi:acetylxylan esterase